MSDLTNGFRRLLETLPIIIFITLIEIGICFAVAGLVLLELMPVIGREHPYVALGTSIFTAIFVQGWLLFNHKLRAYTNLRNNQ